MWTLDSIISRGVRTTVTGHDGPAYTALRERFNRLFDWRDEQDDPNAITPAIVAAAERIVAGLVEMEWDRENTIARRAAWNALAGEGLPLWEIEEALGIKQSALKAAIVRHGL